MAATMPDGISLRTARNEDALCISVLAMHVFLDTYATEGMRPSLAREVLAQTSNPVIERQLSDPATTFIVAEAAGHMVGFCQMSFDATHELVADDAVAEIDRLYVHERFTRMGIGSVLLERAELLAASRGARTIWLTAWSQNHRALAFYARSGYADIGGSTYEFEDEVYANRVLAKSLAGNTIVDRTHADEPSDDPTVPVFGEPTSSVACVPRRAAYAVIADETGRVAVVEGRSGCFLPGGGSHDGELPEDTLRRELAEELARTVRIARRLGEAVQYFDADSVRYRMHAVFFAAELIGVTNDIAEHQLRWLRRGDIDHAFFHECHAWAVRIST